MLIEIDQSGKIEQTNLDTVIALSNNEQLIRLCISENYQSAEEMPSSPITHVLHFILSENFSKNCKTKGSSLDNIGGCTRKTIIAGNFDGENKAVFKKSLSRDNMALDSLHARRYNLEFLMPFSACFILTPLTKRDLISLASISSSAKRLSFDIDKSLTGQSFCSIMQSSLNMLFSQRRIGFEDFLKISSRFKHFHDGMHHNPSTFKSRLSMADFTIRNNIFIDFGSHDLEYHMFIFKDFGLSFRTGISLDRIRCAWFDDKNYFEFSLTKVRLNNPGPPILNKKASYSEQDSGVQFWKSRPPILNRTKPKNKEVFEKA